MADIGFIGLGIMGTPMARHLQDAGHSLYTSKFFIEPRPELVENGLKIVDSPKALAEKTDIIILMLPDTPEVKDVLFGENGVVFGLKPGKLVIDMSSISPIETKEFAKKVRETGSEYIDAPVSGGEVGAKNATLSIMAGGEQSAFDRALPLFKLMGKNITLVGDCGDGQVTKVANQIIVALTIEAISEALVLASKAGADPARVREALMGGFASSRILELHGERMIKRTFEPGFRISLHQKDLNLALQSAKTLGVSLPNTASTQELFNSCAANGDSGLDHSGLVKALERIANHEVA
ncbi:MULTISPECIES: 2-hydroxy-3-oxopropionate reductase [unclassified Phyllobacterium]|uniref:2-hydroxy-3-oxopropionate reductase n=1 Tax=Phyllobacterium TaxID=28100 RepID=UPI000DD70EEA|nr:MULTISPECIES: 2-hydroxy-3-oxopropionate reductase [unclassified Phyllobacterium]MBA8903292.1 2-hydroxy-3-oxopropionate reductase [Phyllobacterium sp. P30BS-XVII]UGX88359.1 2-hydroxy-3-oxopropionate reductase [Phyllobacterium sp. T1293]